MISATARPILVSEITPSVSPQYQTDGTPSARPTTGPNGSPTAHPPTVSDQTPSAGPQTGSDGTPSGRPTTGPNGSPTAHPPTVSGQTPSNGPYLDSEGTPSARPTSGIGGSPTAKPNTYPTNAPSAQPPLCGWTKWMDNHKPDAFSGESETFAELRAASYMICDDTEIQGIECRVVGSHEQINETNQVNILCDINSGGLMCFSFDQPEANCLDYEIRVFCEPKGQDCSKTPTAYPPTVSTDVPTARSTSTTGKPTTTEPATTCVDKWSKWINRDTSSGDGIEHEYMTAAEKEIFCPGGKISAIECVTTYNVSSHSAGEVRNASC